tara:strand:- start:9951 stop:10649 length:699 start_codon:yes stop_codon:yes gene_type:complete
MSDSSPTRDILKAEPRPAFVPNRFREAIYHEIDDAMPLAYTRELGKWLYANRDKLVRGGDDRGASRFNHEITTLERDLPTELYVPFRKMLIEKALAADVLDKLATPDFDLRYIETHATLYHHGSHFEWHDDAPGYDQEIVPTRRVTFCYYLHSDPKMFEGGELEFLDGTLITPSNNKLTLFHPVQQHRVRRVDCWSAKLLHGRWALMGWIHGDPPEGYIERMPELRGRPHSG